MKHLFTILAFTLTSAASTIATETEAQTYNFLRSRGGIGECYSFCRDEYKNCRAEGRDFCNIYYEFCRQDCKSNR